MSADVISLDARRKPALDQPRQAIRAFINSAAFLSEGETVTLAVPREAFTALMVAVLPEDGEPS